MESPQHQKIQGGTPYVDHGNTQRADGKRLEDEVTVVDFNPTLYTIASESDYGALKGASGDLYVESEEREINP